jgi:hypothetical protein
MDDKKTPSADRLGPIGLTRLIRDLDLKIPLPATRSEVVAGARRSRIADGLVLEQYPPLYAPKALLGHLKFALRHEPVDMGVLHAVLTALDRKLLENWVRDEHTSVFARRAWYLYELFAGATLDVEDVPPTGYVDLLDPKRHVTGVPVRARRQRVNDNLLGNAGYCPLIRRTDALDRFMGAGLDKQARALADGCEPGVLARVVSYLYTKETKSSYAIEGESPGAGRADRFVTALSAAADFEGLDDRSYVRLQKRRPGHSSRPGGRDRFPERLRSFRSAHDGDRRYARSEGVVAGSTDPAKQGHAGSEQAGTFFRGRRRGACIDRGGCSRLDGFRHRARGHLIALRFAAWQNMPDARRDRKSSTAIHHVDFVLRDPWPSNQQKRCMP